MLLENALEGALLETKGRSCGKTKDPARYKETWWWSDDISNSVGEKRKLWKECKQGNASKYLEAKIRARRTV